MNVLLEIIAFILAAIIASFLIKNIDPNEEEPENKKDDDTVHVRIEEINSVYYAWEGVKFLFQGPDPKEMLDDIMKAFPNKRIEVTTNKELAWLADTKRTNIN